MTSTLAGHYQRKRRQLGSEFQGFYDDSLQTLFSTKSAGPSPVRASKILRHNRRQLVNSVTRWTGHRKYDVHQLVNSLIARCDTLELFGRTGDTDNVIGVTALVTAIANNTLRTARRRQHR
jgi:hypothetical protein